MNTRNILLECGIGHGAPSTFQSQRAKINQNYVETVDFLKDG